MTATTATPTSTDTTVPADPATAATSAPELVMLDPATLLLDGNVRRNANLDKDFVASIREHGNLQAIVAVRTAEGAYRVRFGQRRTLAAIEAGLALVKVEVVGEQAATDAATIERIVTQVHENEHRDGLTVADKSAAVEQLSLLGLTAAQIAKARVASRTEVDAALSVAGSTLAKGAVRRYDFLTLDMAVTLAEFDGPEDKQTAKALVAAAKQGEGHFAHVAQRARDDRARAQARAAIVGQLTEAGVRIIPAPGHDARHVKNLNELVTTEGKRITPAGHKDCPGHAAFVGTTGYWSDSEPDAIYVCEDWKANGHRDRHSNKVPTAQMSDLEREKARAERREVIECNKAWPSATTVRRAWMRSFLARKTPPKGSAGFVAMELAHGEHPLSDALGYGGNSVLHELVGVKTKAALAEAAGKATDARAQVLALAFVLAAYENATSKDTWRRHSAGTSRYFAFLAAQGYELSDVERRCLPTPAKAAGRTSGRGSAPAPAQPADTTSAEQSAAESSEPDEAEPAA